MNASQKFTIRKDVLINLAKNPGSYARRAFQPPSLSGAFDHIANLNHRHRAASPVADPAAFLKFASAAFHQKRKTLRNNLLSTYEKDIVDALPELKQRAEQLSIDQLIALWETLSHASPTHPRLTHRTPPPEP